MHSSFVYYERVRQTCGAAMVHPLQCHCQVELNIQPKVGAVAEWPLHFSTSCPSKVSWKVLSLTLGISGALHTSPPARFWGNIMIHVSTGRATRPVAQSPAPWWFTVRIGSRYTPLFPRWNPRPSIAQYGSGSILGPTFSPPYRWSGNIHIGDDLKHVESHPIAQHQTYLKPRSAEISRDLRSIFSDIFWWVVSTNLRNLKEDLTSVGMIMIWL